LGRVGVGHSVVMGVILYHRCGGVVCTEVISLSV